MTGAQFKGKRIILGVTGSIAAYKAVSLLRTLVQEEADVSVVMTESATRFVAPLTFEVLSRYPVATDLFGGHDDMLHLSLTEGVDLLVIAPATANTLAKCASGLADDLLSTMVLTAQCPLILVPAMDGGMWEHPAVCENVRILRNRGVKIVDPEEGLLASGAIGNGRMSSEDTILAALKTILVPRRSLKGQRVLVSAGPTREPIDAVRFISNGSSGKMGYAIAQAAAERGAEVVLVTGPTELPPPCQVEVVSVTTAEEMSQALYPRFSWSTVLIMAAAVSDFRPSQSNPEKVKKRDWNGEPLELERTVDILATLSSLRTHQVLVGFAAETNSLIENAQKKLKQKGLDLIVANNVAGQDSAFGSEYNQASLVTRDGSTINLDRLPKAQLADRILDEILLIKPSVYQNTH